MKGRRVIAALCAACLIAAGGPLRAQTDKGEDMSVFDSQTGNPVIPAYLADVTIYYDERTDMFYAYGTNDGAVGRRERGRPRQDVLQGV